MKKKLDGYNASEDDISNDFSDCNVELHRVSSSTRLLPGPGCSKPD